jgi:hypothetical protein
VLNCSSHGHALGKCRVFLPPDVVMRPGMFNIRVRKVLVVMDVASLPKPMQPTQRPRLVLARTCSNHADPT